MIKDKKSDLYLSSILTMKNIRSLIKEDIDNNHNRLSVISETSFNKECGTDAELKLIATKKKVGASEISLIYRLA